MFFGVGLKIGPEFIRERVFRRGTSSTAFRNRIRVVGSLARLMQNGFESRRILRPGNRIPIKVSRIGESNDEDPLTMLRHQAGGVDHAKTHVIAEFLRQRFQNHGEGFSLVVSLEMPNVFEEKSARALLGEDSSDVEKQRALGLVGETVAASEAILFAHTGKAERLAGKAGDEDVVIGNVRCVDFRDVPGDSVIIKIVSLVSLVCKPVPFAGENATPAGCLESSARPADAGEEVDEVKNGGQFPLA